MMKSSRRNRHHVTVENQVKGVMDSGRGTGVDREQKFKEEAIGCPMVRLSSADLD